MLTKNYFSYFSTKTYVLGAQKNCLIKFKLIGKKIFTFLCSKICLSIPVVVIVYVFQIGELEETNIPVTMTVVGCPLSFQMTAAQQDLKPMVRSVPL